MWFKGKIVDFQFDILMQRSNRFESLWSFVTLTTCCILCQFWSLLTGRFCYFKPPQLFEGKMLKQNRLYGISWDHREKFHLHYYGVFSPFYFLLICYPKPPNKFFIHTLSFQAKQKHIKASFKWPADHCCCESSSFHDYEVLFFPIATRDKNKGQHYSNVPLIVILKLLKQLVSIKLYKVAACCSDNFKLGILER